MNTRFLEKRFTESDVLALYMKYRESNLGTFSREVGDFIAHSKRDRGATLDISAYMFSQLAFFQTYQGDKKVALNPKGPCGWWLKHYFLHKLKEYDEKEIRDSLGLTKKEVRNKIKSWFPSKSAYPTEIDCNEPDSLYKIAKHFCGVIHGKLIFSRDSAKSEVENILNREGISLEEVDSFLVATAVLLNGKSVEVVPGFTAKVHLAVSPTRSIPTGKDDRWPGDPKGWEAISLPDGNLKVGVSCENNTGDGLVSVGLDLLDTGVDTEPYFCRSLVRVADHSIPTLDLSQNLTFERNRDPIVKPV